MPVTILEKVQSRFTIAGENPSVEFVYLAHGSDDDLEVKDAVDQGSPATYDGLVKQSIRLDPIDHDKWEATVTYGKVTWEGPPSTGESRFSFDTGGGTQHITQSLATVVAKAVSGEPPDHKGAIGVDGERVNGVDIVVPVFHFTETHYKPAGDVTDQYQAAVYALTGKVNDAAFKNFARGELLFNGVSGAQRSNEDWELTFSFSASPNKSNLTVGDITGIDKEGWQYLWIQYDDHKDETANRFAKRPAAVYVEQVYEYGDFSQLGI